MCFLRLHPSVAKSYGIKKCNGSTSIGSMLLQTLEAQGANITWRTTAPEVEGTKNAKFAAYIEKFGSRPGQKLKPLSERPTVFPPASAAVVRGRLPKVSFPALVKLSKARRPKEYTECGNRIGAPAATDGRRRA